jgi:hypothetical protein
MDCYSSENQAEYLEGLFDNWAENRAELSHIGADRPMGVLLSTRLEPWMLRSVGSLEIQELQSSYRVDSYE